VGQEGFTRIEAGAGVLARGIVQEVEKDLFAGITRATCERPGRPFARFQAALRLRPRRALSSAEAPYKMTGTSSQTINN
jgi:hypothetical protein